MKYLVSITLVLLAIGEISCDCGCLKCSKHLQVVSPPYHPYQVIIQGKPPCASGKENPYPKPLAPAYIDYELGDYNPYCQPLAYKYTLQTVLPPPPPGEPLVGLKARADRVVLQRPNCPVYTGDDGDCGDLFRPPCRSIFQQGLYGGSPSPLRAYGLSPLGLRDAGPVHVVESRPQSGPIVDFLINKSPCGCRYDHGKRKKREIPIIRKSVNFLMGFLPHFIRFPFEQTFKYHRKEEAAKPSKTFLQKLQKLNRIKRSMVLGDNEISLPFLRITDVDDGDSEEETIRKILPFLRATDVENGLESAEVVKSGPKLKHRRKEEFLQPLNYDHLLPHNPIFYLLNAPIRFLHQFHKFGQQISPVFKSVPHVFVNSRQYLRKFGKNLRNDLLDFASDFVGDFDDFNRPNHVRPRRFRRSLEQYQPEYSLVFGNQTEAKSRKKRYILKVVDEDEVEEFLREKFGGLIEPTSERPKKKEGSKKKLVVERLAPKVIIDNNGRPFVEINGMKRPLFHKKKADTKEEPKAEEVKEVDDTEDMKDIINSIISKARERIKQPVPATVPNQVVKDRINQILTEIQNLINLDFDRYSTIHSDLSKLENFKQMLVKQWKKILMEERSNDISSKIHLLDNFKELQILRDKAVTEIASILSTGPNFVTKKLIKMLVRLQKLQCLIYRVVEDFGEKIKMGTEFDVRKEIKYVDFLSNLHFIVGQSRHQMEADLKTERDAALESEMTVLEALRKLQEQDDPHKLHEEAHLLWEFKNIDRLQKDTVVAMNEKISRGQKVRKELKILFDLLKQQENCEEKQNKLLVQKEQRQETIEEEDESEEEVVGRSTNNILKGKIFRRKPVIHTVGKNRNFPHKTIIEDKKPVKLVSNGYTMTAYKVSDGFD